MVLLFWVNEIFRLGLWRYGFLLVELSKIFRHPFLNYNISFFHYYMELFYIYMEFIWKIRKQKAFPYGEGDFETEICGTSALNAVRLRFMRCVSTYALRAALVRLRENATRGYACALR